MSPPPDSSDAALDPDQPGLARRDAGTPGRQLLCRSAFVGCALRQGEAGREPVLLVAGLVESANRALVGFVPIPRGLRKPHASSFLPLWSWVARREKGRPASDAPAPA